MTHNQGEKLRMKTNKLTRTLFAGMMTCSLALTTLSAVAAAPTNQTVAATKDSDDFTLHLHKYKVLDGREFDNKGPVDVTDLDGLNEVDFLAVNATAAYYHVKALNPSWTPEAIAKELANNWEDYDHLKGDEYEATTTTVNKNGVDQDGIAEFDLPKKTLIGENMVYSFYLFFETSKLGLLSAQPFGFGMSAAQDKGTTIDLYAKNYGVEKNFFGTGTEELDDDVYSFEVGKALTYKSSAPIPARITDPTEGYTELKFVDEMTAVGTKLVGITEIWLERPGKDPEPMLSKFAQHPDYIKLITSNQEPAWSAADHEFAGFEYTITWDWTDPTLSTEFAQFLEDIAGGKLVFEYQMALTEDAPVYQEIGNEFYTKVTNNHGSSDSKDDSSEVEFGGQIFTKIDSIQKHGLKGAEFVLQRKGDDGIEYAILTDENGSQAESGVYKPEAISWTDDKTKATIIKSGDEGRLEIYGLEAGDYILFETKSPDGYTIADAETKFTISAAETTLEPVVIDGIEIGNTPEDGYLPITGASGILIFIAIGGAAMASAVYYKKRKA